MQVGDGHALAGKFRRKTFEADVDDAHGLRQQRLYRRHSGRRRVIFWHRHKPCKRHLPQHLLALRREYVTPGIPRARSLGAAVIGDRAIRAAWRLGTDQTLTITIDLADTPGRPPPALLPAERLLFTTPRITVRIGA